MFNLFRSQKQVVRFLLAGILLLVAASMVITLVPGLLSTPSNVNDPVLAEVGDYTVTIQDVNARLRDYMNAGQVPSESLAFLAAQIVENLITERVLLQEADRINVTPSEEEVAEALRTQLSFLFPNGEFVGNDSYAAFVRQRFQQSVPEFERNFRNSMVIDMRLRRLVTDNVIVSDEELKETFRTQNEKIQVEYVNVDSKPFESQVKPTEEALAEYFEKSKSRYQIQEKRTLKIMTIEGSDFPDVKVDDVEVQRYFSQNRELYEIPERIKASHILLMTTDKSEEQIAEIEKKTREVLEKVKAGGDFSQLAKEYSEDPGTKDKGGDLDWVTRGQMVENFEKAAFALKPGEISDVIKTEYGFHIIKVSERENAHARPFDEVKDTIREELLQERRQLERIRMMDEALAVARRSGADMETAGKELNVPVLTHEQITQAEAGRDLRVPPDLLTSLFTAPEGEVVSASQEEKTIIGVVAEIVAARTPELTEVTDRVREAYIADQARQLAQEHAKEIAAKVRENGGNLKQVASQYGLRTRTSEFVTRSETIEGLGPASSLGEAAFDSKAGTTGGPVGASHTIFRVTAYQEPDMSKFEDEREQLLERQLTTKQTEIFDIYRDLTRKRYEAEGKITKHQDRVDVFVQAMGRRA